MDTRRTLDAPSLLQMVLTLFTLFLKVTSLVSVTTRDASTPAETSPSRIRSATCLFQRYSRKRPSGDLLPGVSMPCPGSMSIFILEPPYKTDDHTDVND